MMTETMYIIVYAYNFMCNYRDFFKKLNKKQISKFDIYIFIQ